MRVAFVVGTIEGRGGMETTLSHWVRALRQSGMSAQIMLLDPPKHDRWLADLPLAVRLAAWCRGRTPVLASWIHFPFKDYPRIDWLKRADVHFAISHGLQAQLERRFPHQRTVWLPNFIEIGAANPVVQSPDWALVFIGRLAAQKRVDILLRAISRTKPLQIVGDEPERPALEALVSELGL